MPEHVEDAMADIALVFHWSPDVMDKMSLEDLMQWRERARERYVVDEKSKKGK